MFDQAFELARFCAAVAILSVPGILGARLLVPSLPALERWILGATVGLAAAVFLAFVLSYARLSLFYPVWLLASAILLIVWYRRRRSPRTSFVPSPASMILAIVLALVASSRFGATFLDVLPPGWDSCFHLILAKKLALAGRMVTDWEPFENISLNYPLGSHVLVAITAAIARIPLHTAFKLLMPAFGVLTTALIFLFGSRVSGREEVGAFSALAYGLWAVYGSIDYYRWGGLPNAIAMAFLVAVLVLLCTSPPDRRRSALACILLVSIALTHHHVMLVAGFVLLALAGVLAVSGHKDRAVRGLVVPLIGAAILGSFYFVPYALKATTLGSTGVLTFDELLFTPAKIVLSFGIVLSAAAGLGVWQTLRSPIASAEIRTLHVVAVSLLLLFVGFEYVYRLISWARTGTGYVAFTPSRFLADLAYMLSVYAGIAVVWTKDRFQVRTATATAACLALALTTIPAWKARDGAGDPVPLFRAFQWIESHTPPDALVLNRHPWAVYGTWRRCRSTPIPISEPSRDGTPNSVLFEAIENGTIPPEVRGTMIVQVVPLEGRAVPWPILWTDGSGIAVVEWWHGERGAHAHQDLRDAPR